jgi:hypothetical protein
MEGSVCEGRSARDGRAFMRTEGPSVKGKIVKQFEAFREKVKPTVPRLIFDGRKEDDNRKRGFEEYMRERKRSLLAPGGG